MDEVKKKEPKEIFSFGADKTLARHIRVWTAKQPVNHTSWGIRAMLRKLLKLEGGGRP